MPIIQQSQNLPANGVPISVGLQLATNALMARDSLDAYQRCINCVMMTMTIYFR